MATKIFVNLPVKDLEASKKFYVAMGGTINPKFTDATAACIVFSDTVYAMLLTYPKFKEFTKKEIVDATKSTEVLNALAFDTRAEVDRVANAAEANGGTRARPPEDHGFMYTRPIQDPDGHVWEAFWMDPSQV